MDARTRAACRAASALLPAAERWLEQWLRIRSISGSRAHRGEVERAATLVAARLRRFAAVRVLAGAGGPVVVARVRGRDPHRPAVLVYGHLDVKPAGAGWHGEPFAPVRRGRRLVARGASDDKGQVLAHLVALEAWAGVGGPPGDVVVVLESAEEIGSPGLADVLARLRSRGLPGVGAVLVSDTRLARPGVPSLTLTQRGVVGLRVTVDTGGPAVHAGRYGGAVRDPSLVLAAALARASRWLDQLPVDRAVPPAPSGADRGIRRAAARAVYADRLAERVTARAALSVTSWRAGGPPGAVPRSASARIDVRLPPSVSPREVEPALRAVLRQDRRAPLAITIAAQGSCRGFVAHHSPATLAAVRRASVLGFGRPCEVVASGGSIPAVVTLAEAFGCSPVLLGLGPVDDHAHGPDESLDLDDLAKGVTTAVVLLDLLPAQGNIGVSESCCANSVRNVVVGHPGRWLRGDAEKRSGTTQTLEGRHD